MWYGITPDSKETQYNVLATSLTSWWAALRSKTEPGVSDRDVNGLKAGGMSEARSSHHTLCSHGQREVSSYRGS